MRSRFAGSRDYLTWQPVELTDSSIDVLRRKFGQVYREFLEMAELDQHSSQPRHSVGLLLAFRPWVFSLVAARQRRGVAQRLTLRQWTVLRLNERLMGRDHPSNSCQVRVRLQLE